MEGDEVSPVVNDYGAIARERVGWYGGEPTTEIAPGDRPFMIAEYHSERPRWFL